MIKINFQQRVWRSIQRDLKRPHKVAYERVGFIFCRCVGNGLISPVDYMSVEDSNYVPNESVGAMIDAVPIRAVIHKALRESFGVFHVHEHLHRGIPRFSLTDIKFLESLIPALMAVSSKEPHGGLLLSEDSFLAKVWMPDKTVQHTKGFIFTNHLPKEG